MRDCMDSSHCPAIIVQRAHQPYQSPLDERLDEAGRRRRAHYGTDRYLPPTTVGRLTDLLATWLVARGIRTDTHRMERVVR